MSRIAIIAGSVAGVVLIGGILALGASSAPPAQQPVHKDLAVAELTAATQPAPPPVPTIIPPQAMPSPAATVSVPTPATVSAPVTPAASAPVVPPAVQPVH